MENLKDSVLEEGKTGYVLMPGEEKRIEKALEALADYPHAPRTMEVKIVLHVYRKK